MKKRKILIIIGVILLLMLLLFLFFNFFKNKGNSNNISFEDKILVTDKYLKNLNERLLSYGINEKITKDDFIVLDSIIKTGIVEFGTIERLNETLTKENGGMVGFTYREQLLFKPQIKQIRQFCKMDKEYCNVILGK